MAENISMAKAIMAGPLKVVVMVAHLTRPSDSVED